MTFAALNLDRFAGAHDAAIAAEIERQHGHRSARAHRTAATRYRQRAASTEQLLAEILPARIAPGETWDVISNGDLDAMSYLRHALASVSHFDRVLVSTWRVQRGELEQLRDWLEAGRIDDFTLIATSKMETQMNEAYELAQQLVADYGIELKLVQNHSKVTLAINEAEGYHLAARGSANLNTNPRVEQVTLTNCPALCAFYLEFFHGIRNGDRR